MRGRIWKLLEGERGNHVELENRNEKHFEPTPMEEVNMAIGKLKINKSPGSDGISAKLFEHGGPHITDV